MTRRSKIVMVLLTFMVCIGLTVGISAAVLADDVTTETYDIYIDVSTGGTLVELEDSNYSGYIMGSSEEYTASKTADGMLLISGVQAGESEFFYIVNDVINVAAGKMLDGFEVNTAKTATSVSCTIQKEGLTYPGTTWIFSDLSSTGTENSHTIYVNAVYADTAEMYVSLANGVTASSDDSEIYDSNSDITDVDIKQDDGYMIITARKGTTISFADILSYTDGYYTTTTAVAGQDGTSQSNMVTAVWNAKTNAVLTTVPTANTLSYTGSAQALVTAGAADGGVIYYSLTGEGWSEGVPTATDAGTYTVFYKVTADKYHYSIDTASVSVVIDKGVQTAPSAPTLASSTTSSITVTAVAANANGASAEYSLDGTTWQSSTEFTGLTAGTAYTVYVRYAETDNYNASDVASASLSTASDTSGSESGDDDTSGGSESGGEDTSGDSGSSGNTSSSGTDYDYNDTSSSSTSTTTTTNADGSTTTTVTNTSARTVTETTEYTDGTVTTVVTDSSAGTVTETTEYTDGSTMTVVTDTSTGTVTETVEQSDGTVIETVTNGETGTITEKAEYADGTVTETVINGETGTITSVTEHADGSTIVAVTDGETGTKTTTETTVENVVIETVDEPGANVVATVTLPESVSTATVTIPAETSSGTVAMDADTGEIIVLSVATDDGLVVKLDSSANIVLVDNSKDFTDTEGHWAEDAIDFATSHELFNGTSEETFSPDEAMTRGMLAQVLYNLEGVSDQSFIDIYTDVLESDWYSDAVSWASEAGVISGYGDGTYGADDVITREQMATILYRYAQYKGYDVSVGEDTNILSYLDYAQVSEYAIEAMQWAVGSGLIQGTSEGLLDPLGSATRAQIATILQRFITNMTTG